MKRLVLKSALLVFVSVLYGTAFAYDFSAVCESGQTLYYNIISNVEPYMVEVTYQTEPEYNFDTQEYSSSYSSLSGSLVIPSSVTYNDRTYSVTCIGNSAFYNCDELTSVTISNSVARIGESAFSRCWGLMSVAIPNSVTSIGIHAFENTGWWSNQSEDICYLDNWCLGAIKGHRPTGSLTIREGSRGIADYAFSLGDGLNDVTIPESVMYIGNYAFFNCSSLSEITIPNSVKTIGEYAFCNCTGLTTLTIGSSVTNISKRAFDNCRHLTSVSYNGDVADWCRITFDSTDGTSNPLWSAHNLYINNELVTDLIIPETITSVNPVAFYSAQCLTSVTIPNTVTTIGYYAFAGCNGISKLKIPNSVTSIDDGAFIGWTGLTLVAIGNSVERIGIYAFAQCNNLDTIYSFAINPPTIESTTFNDSLSIPIIVPCGSAPAYNNAEHWNHFTNIQEDCSDVDENEIVDLQIFPNPVSNILNISSSEEISEIEIVNVMGQVVYRTEVNGNNAVCDVEDLKSGVYVVKIYGNAASTTLSQRRFVKK